MKIITKEIQNAFDKQGETAQMPPSDIVVICKLFNPTGAGTWYLYEQDRVNPDIYWCFANLGDTYLAECGTVSLSELMSVRLPLGLSIERDMQFPVGKMILADVISKVKSGGHV